MSFGTPLWLALIIPAAIFLWTRHPSGKLLTFLRGLAILLVLFAMASPGINIPSRIGTVIVVADRSQSMPHDADASHKEIIDILMKSKSNQDQLGVISFGRDASIEINPNSGTEFTEFAKSIYPDASNLSEAIDVAQNLIPPNTPGRILVISDGRNTGPSPTNTCGRAVARDIAIDFRCMQRSLAGDVAVQRIDIPDSVTPGETYMVTAWIQSPISQEISFKLLRNKGVLASGQKKLKPGLNRMVFRDIASLQPGTMNYSMQVSSKTNDPVPENNIAKAMMGVKGPKPVLCISGNKNSLFPKFLESGGLNIVTANAKDMDWSLAELSGYSSVILENNLASDIGTRGMENIAAWIKQSGAGLMITGGRSSYGIGGYYHSPLDPALPVSMELRKEHRKFSLAIVVAMDRSGSMGMTVPGGQTKMDLADRAASEVYDLITPMDEFSCIAIDSTPHVIVPMQRVDKSSNAREKILRIQSMGGGIYVYEALKESVRQLSIATAGTKHIILFSDAADSEQPGQYKSLLAKCQKMGITCSVIGLGTPKDCDADFLKDVAKRGGGRCYFTTNATDLPRLFAQDTFVVARNAFLEEITAVKATGAMATLTGTSFRGIPTIGGYNLCYIKPEADMNAITRDEYNAPLVASWQYGIGRVLCYTGEADGKYTGAIAKWKQAGDWFSSMAKWTAGLGSNLHHEMLATQETSGGVCKIRLHLDPRRKTTPFKKRPLIRYLRGQTNSPPENKIAQMEWITPDELVATIPLNNAQTVLATIDAGQGQTETLSPTCLPYCPEFKPVDPKTGIRTLLRIARDSGGVERLEPDTIWEDLPRKPRIVSIAPWLLLAAAFILLLDVLQRRTGLLTDARSLIPGSRNPQESKAADQGSPTTRSTQEDRPRNSGPRRRVDIATNKTAQPKQLKDIPKDDEEDLFDALDQVRKQADKRNR